MELSRARLGVLGWVRHLAVVGLGRQVIRQVMPQLEPVHQRSYKSREQIFDLRLQLLVAKNVAGSRAQLHPKFTGRFRDLKKKSRRKTR